MTDRKPTYPNRVQLTKADGTAETVTWEYADQPLTEGTPLNKANLLDDTTAAAILPGVEDPTINQALREGCVTVYTHSRVGQVHEFTGSGSNGRALVTAAFQTGDIFTVNGQTVAAYAGADAVDSDTMPVGRWVCFTYDGTQINFKGGGGLGSSRLSAATAAEGNVLSGKTFYSQNKSLKTGTIASKAAETVTLNATTTEKTFSTSGKYCTGNMVVKTDTKAAETIEVTPHSVAQSHTFATGGKLCTGDMTVNVEAATVSMATFTPPVWNIGTMEANTTVFETVSIPDGWKWNMANWTDQNFAIANAKLSGGNASSGYVEFQLNGYNHYTGELTIALVAHDAAVSGVCLQLLIACIYVA